MTLGNRGPHKKRQRCPEKKDLPVLITVETHSVIQSGEVACGSGSDMLSKVSRGSVSGKQGMLTELRGG